MNKLYTYAVYVSNDQTLGPLYSCATYILMQLLVCAVFLYVYNTTQWHAALQGIFYFFNRPFCIHSILDCSKKERFSLDDE